MAKTASRTERKLSDKQISILKTLKRKPHTVSETVELINKATSRKTNVKLPTQENYFSVHGSLRRLEDRNYVRRTYNSKDVAVWELTAKGREAVS